jgi:type IV secretory pathway VirB2 component (pilin)
MICLSFWVGFHWCFKKMRLLKFSLYTVIWLSLFPSTVLAQSPPPAQVSDLNNIVGNVISILAPIGGFLALIFLIVGGFRYITAQGDPKASASARSTITWAILGLVFLILAWLILKFVSGFTGIPEILQFNI